MGRIRCRHHNSKVLLSEQQIRALLLDLLPVVQFIHEHQVIHRDIKPDNILRRNKRWQIGNC